MNLKTVYLLAAVLGAVVPYIFFIQFFGEFGIDLMAFVPALFANGAAGGFTLVMVLFGAIREQLNNEDVPPAFQGPGIALVTAGIMSLAFMGFQGFAG